MPMTSEMRSRDRDQPEAGNEIHVFLEVGSAVRLTVVEAIPRIGQTLTVDDRDYTVVNRRTGPEGGVVVLELDPVSGKGGTEGWANFGPLPHR
jgi:hypothetical protein